VSESRKQWNPYLAMTPCCGKLFCLKCCEISNNIASALEGKGEPEAQRYVNAQGKRLDVHLAKYDHEYADVYP
jgi:hypothetical protein